MASLMMTRHKGFSLIELMIAMALGMFLVAGFGHLFLSSSLTYRAQDELARMQESARFAFDILAREIRMAGYTGCPQSARLADVVDESITSSGYKWAAGFGKRMEGFDKDIDSMGTLFGGTARAGSDAIVIHRGDPDNSYFISNHNLMGLAITTSESHSMDEGDLVVMAGSNCRQVAAFAMTSVPSGNQIVGHWAGGPNDIRNCMGINLGGHADCTDMVAISMLQPFSFEGGHVMAAATAAYFIGTSLSGDSSYRSLRRIKAGGFSEELVEGIEGMRIFYGLDTDAVPDGIPNRYVKGEHVTDTEWRNVAAVRLHLLVRSLSESSPAPQTYQFVDQVITASDRFIRQEYSMTVTLRSVDE